MKLHKFTKILLIVTITALIVSLLLPLVTRISGKLTTDSGFDSSYDSGGYDWDSGSSWDSSSSWDYDSSWDSDRGSSGGGGSSVNTPLGVIFTIIFMMLILYVAIYLLVLPFRLKKFNAVTNNSSGQNSSLTDDVVNNMLAKYGLTKLVVLQLAFASYKRIQIAWMNGDVDPVRDVLSDEMYNMYKTQLMTLKAKNEKNMMEEISFKGGNVENILEQNDDVSLTVNLKVTCKDYIINTKNNIVVRGNENRIWNYNYKLTFTFNKNAANITTNCPNCNAKLPLEGKSVKCEYCGSVINRESTKLVMTKKEMLSQN